MLSVDGIGLGVCLVVLLIAAKDYVSRSLTDCMIGCWKSCFDHFVLWRFDEFSNFIVFFYSGYVYLFEGL